MNHPRVRLGSEVDGERLDEVFGETYCEDNGRPGTRTRLLVALHYLKYTFNLSDENVVEAWVENPYWQHLSGNQYFEHDAPIDPSVMSRFRTRIGEAGAEELLKVASRLPLPICISFAYLIELYAHALRSFRLENPCPDRPDQALVFC